MKKNYSNLDISYNSQINIDQMKRKLLNEKAN